MSYKMCFTSSVLFEVLLSRVFCHGFRKPAIMNASVVSACKLYMWFFFFGSQHPRKTLCFELGSLYDSRLDLFNRSSRLLSVKQTKTISLQKHENFSKSELVPKKISLSPEWHWNLVNKINYGIPLLNGFFSIWNY